MKKIALPVVDGNINGHFGHSHEFHIITLDESGNIISTEVLKTEQECGCKSNMANDLRSMGVSIMLAGGLGKGAKSKLNNAGIDVFTGFTGNIENAVKKWLSGDYVIDQELCSGGHNCSH